MLGAGASAVADFACALGALPPLTTKGAASGLSSVGAALLGADEADGAALAGTLGVPELFSTEATSPVFGTLLVDGLLLSSKAGAVTAGPLAGCAPLGLGAAGVI